MLVGIPRRVGAAVQAFLSPPKFKAVPLRNHVHDSADQDVTRCWLTEEDKARLTDLALGLHDPDVRGWLVVTVREHLGHADIDVDFKIPAVAWPGVYCVLGEAVLEQDVA